MIKRLFLRDKPSEILVLLKKGGNPKYATQVSKGTNCTYSHVMSVLKEFEQLGLARFKKTGRIKLIELTERGLEIAHDLEGLMIKFSRIGKKEPAKEKKVPEQAERKSKRKQEK